MEFIENETSLIAHFTPEELALCKSVAATRLTAKAVGVKSKKWTEDEDELSLHVMGVRSELAVAELIGCPKDSMMLVYHRGGDRGLPDLMALDGSAINVKCRSRRDGDFLTEHAEPRDFADDIGVLCFNRETGVEILGWFTRDEFIANAAIVDYGYGPRCAMRQVFMRHPDTLKGAVSV
jgi:hypothetical protein